MKIDERAPFAARKEILVSASPKTLWKLLSDINKWSQWQRHITMSKMDGPLKPGTVFHWKADGLNITSTLQVVRSNKSIGWSGTAFGTRARHVFTFRPRKKGTLVIAEESLDGWLAHVMKLVTPNFLENSMQSSLQNLKLTAETHGQKGGPSKQPKRR